MVTLIVILGIFAFAVLLLGLAIAIAAIIFTAAGWLAGIIFSALEAILGVYIILCIIKACLSAF